MHSAKEVDGQQGFGLDVVIASYKKVESKCQSIFIETTPLSRICLVKREVLYHSALCNLDPTHRPSVYFGAQYGWWAPLWELRARRQRKWKRQLVGAIRVAC
jgi:hypothetical protein